MMTYKNYNRYEKYDVMMNYHGLKCIEQKLSQEECCSLVKKNIVQSMPVIIGTDIYQCSWNRYYQQKHNEHFLLVTDYQNGLFTCLDTYVSNNTYTFSWDEIALQSMLCSTFEIKESQEDLEGIFKVIRNYLLRYEEELNSSEINAQSLSEGIMEHCDFNDEYDITMHEPIRQIKIHEDRRYCYLEMIQKIEHQFNINLSSIQSYLLDIISVLKDMKRTTLVHILSTNRKQKDIHTYIQKIIDLDKIMVSHMKNIVNDTVGD